VILEAVTFDELPLLDCGAGLFPVGLTDANLGSGPEPRTSSEGKPSADGTVNRTRFWGPRIVELVGYVATDTREELNVRLDEIRAAFSLREAHVLRFVPLGQDEHELEVVVASRFEAPVSGWQNTLTWAVTLEAPDPRLYLAAVVEVSYEPTVPAGATAGLLFPLAFPLVFSTAAPPSGGDTFLSAWNNGTTSTPVELTLEGPVTSLQGIRNLTTGEAVDTVLTGLAAGDLLVVDTAARTVTLNGAAAPELVDAAGTTWFELIQGENQLDVDGAGFEAGATKLTAKFREAKI
jgi:Phage tail protein